MKQPPHGILCCQGSGRAHFPPSLLGDGHAAFTQQRSGCPTHLELSGTNLVTGVPQNAGKATDLSKIHPAPSCMLPHPEEGEAPLERGQAGSLCRGGGVEELTVCSHSSGQYTLPLLSWEVFCWEVEVLR